MSSAARMANLVVVAFVSVALLVVATVYLRRKRNNSKVPPGWRGWPVVGETVPFLASCESTVLGGFMELRLSRFGKIFSTNILGSTAIVSADQELNRFVLQNEFKLFGRYAPQHLEKLLGGQNNIGFDSHGKFRSLLGSFLSSSRLQTCFRSDAEGVAERLLAGWKDGSVVSIAEVAQKFTVGVMAKNVLGMETGQTETEKLRADYGAFVNGLFALPLRFPGSRYYKALQAKERLRKVVVQKIEERVRLEESTRTEETDLIGSIIKRASYSLEQTVELVITTLFLGGDGVSKAICLVLYFLESCPKALEQLREEHIRVADSKTNGTTELTWDAFKQMEFTHCVIQESLRLGNVSRFLLKKATKNIKFKGYEIPRGCKMVTHLSAVHLDPTNYEDPQLFNPWRWLSTCGFKKDDSFMAFGAGPRQCPGAELVRLEIAIFLHHFVLSYNWKLAEQVKPIASLTVSFPNGLLIEVQALSSKH